MAIIGSSGHASRIVAPVIAEAAGARLAGVLGSTPERGSALAQRYPGARSYESLEALCEDSMVDAVWVAGPNDRHAEHAHVCLSAGKHVLLEKPMATTAEAAQRLAEVSVDTGTCLLVGFQHRFRPGHAWLRDAVQSARFGEIGLLRIHRFWPFPYFPEMSGDPAASWRSSPARSGGWVLNDIGAHLLDLARWVLDVPLELVCARTTNVRFTDVDAEDTAVLVLQAPPRVTVVIETSNAMSSFPGAVELHGTAGWARAGGTFDGGGWIDTDAGERLDFAAITASEVYGRALADFLGALSGAPPHGASATEAAETVAIVEAAVADRMTAPVEQVPVD